MYIHYFCHPILLFCRTLTARLPSSGDCLALFINCNVESDKQMAQVNKVSECAKPMKRAFTLKMVKIKCTVNIISLLSLHKG